MAMTKLTTVPVAKARKVLAYDPESGAITWRVAKGKDAKPGDVAGCVHPSGYRRIGVCGALIYAHRLAWILYHGRDPVGEIDHINGERDDNRIANLRDVPPAMNNQNIRVSPLSGARALKSGRWYTTVPFMGCTVRAGLFDTDAEAHAMYVALKKRLHDGFVGRV
jgi:hypothetical protein